jgi:regulatory protein
LANRPVFDADESLQRARELSYAFLNRRDRTVSEVSLHLERKGVGPELVEHAVRELCEQGLLDDARYARLFVSDKRELEQWGSERIRRGLISRGIERGLAEAALSSSGEAGEAGAREPSELERALELLRRRYPSPPEDRRELERALGVLLRKGYESDLALDALSAYARDG